MEKIINTIIRVIGFAGSVLLTLFAGMFALVGIGAFVATVITPSVIGVIGSVGMFGCACVCWSVRRDVLV